MKKMALVMMCALIAGTTAWAIDGTNVWSGTASGGDWGDPANWTATNSSYTAAELLQLDCVYDVSALADGAHLTNTITNLKIAGIITKNNQGTLTFSGSNFKWEGSPQIMIAAGTTVKWQMNHPNPWGDANSPKVILGGSGTLRLEPTSDITFYRRRIEVCHDLTLVIGSNKCFFQLTYLVQWDNSKVRLEHDLTVAYHCTGHDTCSLDLNGHNLYVCGGESYESSLAIYRGTVTGEGAITHVGGWTGKAYSSYHFSGPFSAYTGDLEFQSGASVAETVRLEAEGPGRFIFPASQTLANLSGRGAVGGVQMADNTTLTLTGTADTSRVLEGRIYGQTDIVKNGAGYEQVLSGDNAYTGSTTVAAGTLTLRRPILREGLVAYWPFDDPGHLGRDFGPYGFHLTPASIAGGVATQSVQGVVHRPSLCLDSAADGFGCGRMTVGNLSRTTPFPVGNDPISVSFWTRPSATNPDVAYLFRVGDWGNDPRGGLQLTVWQRTNDRINICIVNWSTDDGPNSPVVSCPGLTDGNWHHIAVTYANRSLKVYYDGELKSTKTTTMDLALAVKGATTLVFGNNDPNGGRNGQKEGANHRFYGGVDEACVWNRELTADEVAQEYALSRPVVTDPATLLPDPVCHWAFNDAGNVGKDEMGRANLVANELIATSPAVEQRTGSYGGNLTWNSSMKLPAADFPVNFPTGNAPFTVSVRFLPGAPGEQVNLLTWGDTTTRTNTFRLFYVNCPRRLTLECGSVWQNFNWSNNSTGQRGAWTHVILSGDPSKGVLTFYRDGVKERMRTGFDANILAQDLYLNCNNAHTAVTGLFIDDIRIYDRALTDSEAMTLSRSLEKGVVGPVIPANSDVTVAAGATLKVDGEGHAVKSLAGAGEVFLNGPATLQPGTADAFTGTVGGTGTLILSAAMANATVTANVAIPDGANLVLGPHPLVTTSGVLFVPENGTVTFVPRPQPGHYVIATGAQAEAAAEDLAGWTVGDINPGAWGTSFSLIDGAFVLDVKARGLMVILR